MFRCHISYIYFFFLSYLLRFTLCPYTTLFRSDTGRQLALWGQHDGNRQVNRAATRLQVMLGHDGVTRAVVTGGRSPVSRAERVPWGDVAASRGEPSRPWPGSIPPPAPAVVHPTPRPASVLDRTGRLVSVSARSVVSAPPTWLVVDSDDHEAGTRIPITEWTGPWPMLERWWTDDARRAARFQLVAADGQAFLARLERSQWFIDAVYS